MSDQNKCVGVISYLADCLYRILLIVGPIFTFGVGCAIFITAMCCLAKFTDIMMMQVTPSQEIISNMIGSILLYTLIGTVLILYSISLFLIIFNVRW
jgi:hypothetical protein